MSGSSLPEREYYYVSGVLKRRTDYTYNSFGQCTETVTYTEFSGENAAALGAATGYLGGAGVRANPAVKKADATCLKVLNKAQAGGYATLKGAKSAMTQAINGVHKAFKPVIKTTFKTFTRSAFLGAAGMYAYDYVNR